MKQILAIVFLFTCACICQAQVNYVLNPSFEQYTNCPNFPDQIKYANYWSPTDTITPMPLCAPEYCNACDTTHSFGVPQGAFYYHFARTGNGMGETVMYQEISSIPFYKREYLQGRLRVALTAGRTYCVTFFVSLNQQCMYACNNIGAFLDNGNIDATQDSAGCALPQTLFYPQINEISIIDDTLNWVKVQGSFTASGNERFITIGNFFDNAHTLVENVSGISGGGAYYLVDDVSVIESTQSAHAGTDIAIVQGDSAHIGTSEEGMPETWYILGNSTPIGYGGGIWVKPSMTTSYVVEMDLCGNVTRDTVKVWVWPVGVRALPFKKEPIVWPNPVRSELHISNALGGNIIIFDFTGRSVYQATISTEEEVIDLSGLVKGLYTVQLFDAATNYKSARIIVKE